LLSLDDFKPLKLEDKPLFEKHYAEHPPMHSDNMFTTMISWMDYSDYHYTFLENNLLICTKIKDRLQFRPPSGKYTKGVVDQVLKLAEKEGSDPPFALINSKTKDLLSKDYPKLDFIDDRDYFDYVYLASNLAELSGSDFSKVRNRLNKFKRNSKYTIEEITEENMDEVGEFLKRWCLWKDCESDPLLENERKAILYSMSHWIKGDIESIAVYEKMSPDTAVVHYEKGSPDYDGIYKAINQETAKILQKEVEYINRESDMGIPGLRKAKISYRPHHMVEVFHVNKQNMSF
jgi:hypothetical protein